MSRFLQIQCDNQNCINMIEVVGDDEDEVNDALFDFNWTTLYGEDLCPDCSDSNNQMELEDEEVEEYDESL